MNKYYPYYLHTSQDFCNYWEDYFEHHPISKDDSFEIYIDFPFCRSICKFCVFGSYTISEYKDYIKRYEELMVQLTYDMRNIFPNQINNIYFGGGTPSLWNKDVLKEIIHNIKYYDQIKLKMFEIHPFDINDELIHFLIHDLKIDVGSIGIQTFDEESNQLEHRLNYDPDQLRHLIQEFHRHGKFINTDLVALFHHDNHQGWDIFREDLDKVYELNPDGICSVVNFRRKNYYGKTKYFRKILEEFLNTHKEYVPANFRSLTGEIQDILSFEEEPYHIKKQPYHKYYQSCKPVVIERNPEIAKHNIIIAFGGNQKHPGISRAGRGYMEEIRSSFDVYQNKFIHEVVPINTSKPSLNHPLRVMNQIIDPEYDFSYNGN